MKHMLLVLRLVLGGMLLWAGLTKARQPFEFLSTVYDYRLLGPSAGLVVAAALPWLEMIAGCCLLTGVMVEGSLVVATALTAMFAMAIASAWYRGLGINCGCFGAKQDVINGMNVLRSLGLVMASLFGLVIALRIRQFDAKGSLDSRPLRETETNRPKESPSFGLSRA